jgi:hypothetical protein
MDLAHTTDARESLLAATSVTDEGLRGVAGAVETSLEGSATVNLDDGLRQLVNWWRAETALEAVPAGALA